MATEGHGSEEEILSVAIRTVRALSESSQPGAGRHADAAGSVSLGAAPRRANCLRMRPAIFAGT
jgi:hypothetical protein